MPYSYLGNEGLVQGLTAGDAFFNCLGSTVNEKTFCASGSSTAWLLTVGPTGGVDPESFVHSQLHRDLGLQLDLHQSASLAVRARGAEAGRQDRRHRLLPLAHGEAGRLAHHAEARHRRRAGHGHHRRADRERPCRPGLGRQAHRRLPRACRARGGIHAGLCGARDRRAGADIAKFAREFATIQPSVIRMGVALERHAGGGQTIRAVCAIPALTGSWRHVGGGLLQMPLWEFPVDWARVSRPDFIRPGTRVVNNLQLGRALIGDMKLDPPIMGLYIYNTNPVSQAPETNKIVRGPRPRGSVLRDGRALRHRHRRLRRHRPARHHGRRARRHDVLLGPFLSHPQRAGDRAVRRGQVERRDLPPARGGHGLRRSAASR